MVASRQFDARKVLEDRDWHSLLLALAASFVLLRHKINSAWLVSGEAAIGLLKLMLS